MPRVSALQGSRKFGGFNRVSGHYCSVGKSTVVFDPPQSRCRHWNEGVVGKWIHGADVDLAKREGVARPSASFRELDLPETVSAVTPDLFQHPRNTGGETCWQLRSSSRVV